MRGSTKVTVGSQTSSQMVVVDYRENSFSIGIGCVVNSGTLTYGVQYTYDDPQTATDAIGGGLTWFTHSTITAKSANFDGSISFPIRAVRLTVTAFTSGSVTMTIVQGSK